MRTVAVVDRALQLHHQLPVVSRPELPAGTRRAAAAAGAEPDQRFRAGRRRCAPTIPRGGHDARGQDDPPFFGHARGEGIAELQRDQTGQGGERGVDLIERLELEVGTWCARSTPARHARLAELDWRPGGRHPASTVAVACGNTSTA